MEEMILQETSQIFLVAGNISASQGKQILIALINIPALQEVIKDQKFHEQHLDEDLQEIK
jgi:hypothetical protein